ncbi:3'(2'),5'-bisphosphate nucleotidase CysQ [Hoeflea sp.]|uniref:3'(2'),5'-bisphosphate nucleotidase CysQ n=1 Tax=Hoeflea sp. TaxID=1940281 RepID=UPI003A8E3F08
MPAIDPYAEDLALILEASREAAEIAMRFFRKDPGVWYKNEGRSPVSEADVAIDRLLQTTLLAARPDYGWLSEEAEDNELRLSHRRIFVVDPIDGTRAYVAGREEWCVSIGIVEDGLPVAGVLVAPALGEIWQASLGAGAFLNGKKLVFDTSEQGAAPLRVIVPDVVVKHMRPGTDGAVDKVPGGPSLALRLAAVARGDFDGVYIRPSSNEWDLAAADVMLGETGHRLVDLQGARMRYNAPDPSRELMLAASEGQLAQLLEPFGPAAGH